MTKYILFYIKHKTADLKNFFKELINIGNIPMTLFQWEINDDWSVLEEIVPGLY